MSVSNIKPLHDNILVRRKEQAQKRASGIYIPETAQDKPMEGEVVAVSDGMRDENGKIQPLTVKVGDTVLFAKWGGTEVRVGEEDYLVMKERDVLAVINQ